VEKQYVLRIASLSVALVIQQAKRMRPLILSPVACLAALYLSTYKARFSEEKNTEKQMRILVFFTTFV